MCLPFSDSRCLPFFRHSVFFFVLICPRFERSVAFFIFFISPFFTSVSRVLRGYEVFSSLFSFAFPRDSYLYFSARRISLSATVKSFPFFPRSKKESPLCTAAGLVRCDLFYFPRHMLLPGFPPPYFARFSSLRGNGRYFGLIEAPLPQEHAP